MKRTSNILIAAALISGAFLSACKDNRKPGKIYMPDMYEARTYKFYDARLAGMKPVEGTIPRGVLLPYHLKEADTAQANGIKNPLTITKADLDEGQRLYNVYCGICHGTKLDGNGPLYKGGDGPYPAAPANLVSGAKANYTEGRLFHVMTFGYNMMGSYASQLNREQRWKVAAYIKSMQPGGAKPPAEAATAGAAAAKDSTVAK